MERENPACGQTARASGATAWPGGILVRATVSVLAFAAVLVVWLAPANTLPFRIDDKGGLERILARPGVPLPAPLRSGERLALARQPLRTRIALGIYTIGNPPLNVPIVLVLGRKDGRRMVTVRSVRAPPGRHPALRILGGLEEALGLVLGLLTLWWGRDWAGWGLSLLVFGSLAGNALTAVPLPPVPLASFAPVLVAWFYGPMFFLGLYLSMRTLLGHRVRFLHGRDLAYFLLILFVFLLESASVLASIWLGAVPPFLGSVFEAAFLDLLALLVVLVDLVRGYKSGDHALRLRLRWVLLAGLLLLPTSLLESAPRLLASTLDVSRVLVSWCGGMLSFGVLAIYTWTVVRQRLVEVRVVVNRALVLAVFMAVVVGFFAFTEGVIERSALSRGAGLALEIGVPLLLGILFHRLSHGIERWTERIFFRREYRARKTLLDFAAEAPYIEDPSVLMNRAARAFAHYAGRGAAAVYEADAKGLRLGSSQPSPVPFPERILTDDPALVRLRARRAPIDLHDVGSVLADGLALPFILRGHPYVLVVCGSRPGGRYAQEEIDFLAKIAHEVGAALLGLRAEAGGFSPRSLRAHPASASH